MLKQISETFGVEDTLEPDVREQREKTGREISKIEQRAKELTRISGSIDDTDYGFARENIRSLLGTGATLLERALEVAQQSDQPRATEVATNLMKALVDMNKDLLDIHHKRNQILGTKVQTDKDSESTENINPDGTDGAPGTSMVMTSSQFEEFVQSKINNASKVIDVNHKETNNDTA